MPDNKEGGVDNWQRPFLEQKRVRADEPKSSAEEHQAVHHICTCRDDMCSGLREQDGSDGNMEDVEQGEGIVNAPSQVEQQGQGQEVYIDLEGQERAKMLPRELG